MAPVRKLPARIARLAGRETTPDASVVRRHAAVEQDCSTASARQPRSPQELEALAVSPAPTTPHQPASDVSTSCHSAANPSTAHPDNKNTTLLDHKHCCSHCAHRTGVVPVEHPIAVTGATGLNSMPSSAYFLAQRESSQLPHASVAGVNTYVPEAPIFAAPIFADAREAAAAADAPIVPESVIAADKPMVVDMPEAAVAGDTPINTNAPDATALTTAPLFRERSVLGAFLPADDITTRNFLVGMGISVYVIDSRNVHAAGADVVAKLSEAKQGQQHVTIDPVTKQAIFNPWPGASGPSGSQPPAKRARIGGPAPPSSSNTTESHGARYALVYRPIWIERRNVLRSAAEAGFAATSKNAKKRLVVEGKDTGPVVLEATLHHVFPPPEHLAGHSTVDKIECFALNARALVPLILEAIHTHGLPPDLAFTRNIWRTILSGAWKDTHSRSKKAKDNIKKADRALGLRTLPNGRRLKDVFVTDGVLLGDIPLLPTHLSEDDIHEIAWAVNEYNVRADLILADEDLWRAPSPHTSLNALQDRTRLRRSVFADGALLPPKLDVVKPHGLVARGVERFASLVALRDLMLGWPMCPRAPAFSLYSSPASRNDLPALFAATTEQARLDFEVAVVDAYISTFPAMPAIPPKRLTAPSAAAPSASM